MYKRLCNNLFQFTKSSWGKGHVTDHCLMHSTTSMTKKYIILSTRNSDQLNFNLTFKIVLFNIRLKTAQGGEKQMYTVTLCIVQLPTYNGVTLHGVFYTINLKMSLGFKNEKSSISKCP